MEACRCLNNALAPVVMTEYQTLKGVEGRDKKEKLEDLKLCANHKTTANVPLSYLIR